MSAFQTSPIFLIDNKWPLYFIRAFTPLLVLLGLIAHQFLFSDFIEPNLAVWAYALCFFILFFDSLALFFYPQKRGIHFFLFFLSAVFLVFLTALIGGASFLFFIFFLIFFQVFPLLLIGRYFLAFVFLLYLSMLFPIAFTWGGASGFEQRLSLVILTVATLFSIYAFSFLFYFFISLFQSKSAQSSENIPSSLSSDLFLSLAFSKKLKPVLNSLLKRFPEKEGGKDQLHVSSVFSPKKSWKELQKLRQFILDFVDFAELDTKFLQREIMDVAPVLKASLNELKAHERRPDNLQQDIQCPGSFKVKGSHSHLKKCFENILVNSFEAVKNAENPAIKIYCFKQRNWLSISFLDNGHGIEKEDKERLFDPFFSKRFGLRGLGLSYVQKVIQAHEGELAIERKESWTKIVIKIPLISGYYDSFDFLKLLKKRKKAA